MKLQIYSLISLSLLVVSTAVADDAVVSDFHPQQLKSGGYVVFFRHTTRDKIPSRSVMWEFDKRSACESGTALNLQGEQEARQIATTIKNLAIPVGEVYASPTCRTKQMARIIVGDEFQISQTLAPPWVRLPSKKDQDAQDLRKLLSSALPEGKNRLLLSHSKMLTAESIGKLISLKQSEAAVFRPLGSDQDNFNFEFLGVIRFSDWKPTNISTK